MQFQPGPREDLPKVVHLDPEHLVEQQVTFEESLLLSHLYIQQLPWQCLQNLKEMVCTFLLILAQEAKRHLQFCSLYIKAQVVDCQVAHSKEYAGEFLDKYKGYRGPLIGLLLWGPNEIFWLRVLNQPSAVPLSNCDILTCKASNLIQIWGITGTRIDHF